MENSAQPALYAIASLTGQAANANGAARTAFDTIFKALAASSGCFLLRNPDTGRLELEAQQGLPVGDDMLTFELGQGLPGWVALHAQPLLVTQVAHDSRYRAVRPEVRCQMVAPLLADEQVLGVIALDHDQVGGFTPADLKRLTALTNETAHTLRRLWLLDQLQGKARQLETLITTGQSLVAKLEPQELYDALTRDARHMLANRACALYLHTAAQGTVRCVSLAAGSIMPLPAGELPVASCLAGA
ncbi:MAG: GAF domain-containing protein, partial [Opitutaceae bacterium]|nr:GAF domain-containing protein [Opitutaceae bacterium]